MAPDIRASVWVDFGANSASNFILDDPTGASLLDDPSRTLADSNWIEVTDSVSGQITTSRGRSRETDQYQAGTCSFTLRNEGRTYDPSNAATSTPLTLRAEVYVCVYIDGVVHGIFDGFIDDFTVSYEMPDVSVISVTCVDAFSILSNVQLASFTPTAGSTTSQAFLDAMTAADVQLPYQASTGSTTVQASNYKNTSVLDYAQLMAKTEQGAVFVDQYGTIQFVGRHDLAAPSWLTFTDDQAAIEADTTGQTLGYSSITQKAATTLLFNEVSASRNGSSSPQTATDSVSRAAYMARSLDIGTVENQTDADVLNLVSYVLGKYAQPELRFDAISVELRGLTSAQASALVSQAQITTTVPVTRTPGSGDPVVRTCIIEGIGWTMDATNGSHRVTFNLASADVRNFFILDDAVFGILDTSKLNY